MDKGKLLTAVLLIAAVTAGNLSAQDRGRVEWLATIKSYFQLSFNPKDDDGNINAPGVSFYEDDDGSAYGWDNMGDLRMWWGKDLVSMWAVLTYRQGWGFDSTLNITYDWSRSGNIGGKFQTGSRFSDGGTGGRGFSILTIDRISLHTWFQVWNRRILMEVNPVGGIDYEWGSVWQTPASFFEDRDITENTGLIGEGAAFFDDNQDVFFRIQFRNIVDNLNFGVALPHFGRLTNLDWGYNMKLVDGEPVYWEAHDLFTRAVIGFKYSPFDFTVAGAVKLDPGREQRAYIGGEYRINNQLGVRADFKLLNIGGISADIGDLDMGQGIQYQDGPLHALFTLYQRNLLWDNNSELELGIHTQVRYTFISRRLLGRLRVYYDHGIGDGTKKQQFEIEPGIFWAIGSQGVTDDLDHYSGMAFRFNYLFGTDNDGSDINEPRLFVGFRFSI